MSENHIPPDPALLAALASSTEVGKRETAVKLIPLYDRVLVKLLKPNERTKSGLYIPETVHDGTPYLKAEVLAVGQGRITTTGAVVPLMVKPGDLVLFFRAPGSGEQLVFPTDDGTEQMLIRESNIAGHLQGLDRVTSIVGVDGGNLELPS